MNFGLDPAIPKTIGNDTQKWSFLNTVFYFDFFSFEMEFSELNRINNYVCTKNVKENSEQNDEPTMGYKMNTCIA